MAKLGNRTVKWIVRLIIGAFLVTGVNAAWISSGKLIPYIVPGTGTKTVDECVVGETIRGPVFGSGYIASPGGTLAGCGPIASTDASASGLTITEVTLHTIYNPDSIKPDICFVTSATAGTGATAKCLTQNIPDQKYGGSASGGTFRLTFTGSNLLNTWMVAHGIKVSDGTNSRGFVGQLDVKYDDAVGD